MYECVVGFLGRVALVLIVASLYYRFVWHGVNPSFKESLSDTQKRILKEVSRKRRHTFQKGCVGGVLCLCVVEWMRRCEFDRPNARLRVIPVF